MNHATLQPRVDLNGIGSVYLIVHSPHGVWYGNQTGGHTCMQMQEQGFLVPFEPDALPPITPHIISRVSVELSAVTLNLTRLQERDCAPLETLLDAVHAQHVLEIDRTRLHDSMEAWIHCRILGDFWNLTGCAGRAAILTWPNSD